MRSIEFWLLKGLLQNLNEKFRFDTKTKETVIELIGVHIEAHPSHHLDSMRGLTDVSFIYLDEADFFPPGQQQDGRDVSERYIAKSNPWIVMVLVVTLQMVSLSRKKENLKPLACTDGCYSTIPTVLVEYTQEKREH